MSTQPCFNKLKTISQEKGLGISEDTLKAVSEEFDKIRSESNTSVEAKTKMDALLKDLAERHQHESWKQLFNLEKAMNAFETISTAVSKGEGVNKRGLTETFIDCVTGGATKLGDGLNRNPHRIRDNFFNDLMSPIHDALLELSPLARSKAVDKDFFVEIHALEKGLQAGVSGNEEAAKFAMAVHKSKQIALRMQQAFDPSIKEIKNHYIRMSHDREKIAAVSFEQWFEKAAPAYWKRTMPRLTNDEKLLAFKVAYDKMSRGIWDGQFTSDDLPKNIMKKLSYDRGFLFSDPLSAADYHASFGKGSVYDAVSEQMYRISHTLALTEKFGSDVDKWATTVDSLIRRSADPDELKKYNSRTEVERRRKYLNAALGEMDSPADSKFSSFALNAMTVTSIAKTGNAWLSSIPDLAMLPLRINSGNNRSFIENSVNVAATYLKDFSFSSATERQKLLRKSYIMHTGVQRDMLRSLGEGDQGTLGTLAKNFHTLTLLNRHTEVLKMNAAKLAMNDLADHVDVPYAALDDVIKRDLARYGIGEHELKLFKYAKENFDDVDPEAKALGLEFVSSQGIRNLPDEQVAKYLVESGKIKQGTTPDKGLLDRTRFTLQGSVASHINALADAATSTPDLKTRTWLLQGHSVNSASGIMWRMFAQFKSAAAASFRNAQYAYYSGANTKRGNYVVLGQAATLSLFYSAIAAYIVDATSGKEAQDPRSVNFALRVAGNSGLGNIWGGVVANEIAQGGSPVKMAGNAALSVLGPVPSTAFKAGFGIGAALVNKPKVGESRLENVAQSSVNSMLSLIPGQNLWATKAAFQYYFAIPLREQFDPKVGRSIEKNTKRNKALDGGKQGYYAFPPSQAHFPWE